MTYRERIFTVSRTFLLHADKVIVRRTQVFGPETEVPIALALLDSDFLVLRSRPQLFRGGLVLLFGNCAMSAVFYYIRLDSGPAMGGQTILMAQIAPFLFAALAVAGVVMTCLSFRRLEYYRFRQAARPEVILLDIARRGPGAPHFEEFVAVLRAQIVRAHRPAGRA